MCARCQHSQYGYHITDKKFLDSIRKTGLSALILRTGSWTASETGSFAKDRVKTLPENIVKTLKDIVLRVMRAGVSADAIVKGGWINMPVLIDVPVTGSIRDNTQLDEELADGVRQYCDELGVGSGSAQGTPKRITPTDSAPVVKVLSNLKDHYLYRLAESYATWRSIIEEKITGQHVYFFVKDHKAVYEKYLRLCGNKSDIALLRAKLCNLSGHEPDGSEQAAIMTVHTVLPQFLEYSSDDESFMDKVLFEEYAGSNIKLWEAKGKWSAL